LIVASVANTMQETQIINQLLWFALIFLSGATVPLAVMPRMVQRVGLFLPSTYLVSGLQHAMVYGRGVLSLGVECLSLLAGGAFLFTSFPWLFRWDRKAKLPRKENWGALVTILPFVLLGTGKNHNAKL